jgi:hypothetical protein
MAGPLQDSADATWSGSWEGFRLVAGEGIILMRAWVAAPEYAIVPIVKAVPDDAPAEEIARRLAPWEPPTRRTFESIEATQAALGFPLYRPHLLPADMLLDSVTIETGLHDASLQMNVRQMYRLPDDDWLELIQLIARENVDYAGWGQARYASEARTVTVNEATGFLVRRFGWWVLDWKVAGTGFELRAPATALSLDELLAIAAAVQPLE